VSAVARDPNPANLSGAQALALDPGMAAKLHRYRLLAAQRARKDIFAFYDFVMRKPDGNEPVCLADAPHHRVMLEFMMAHKECAILAPVGSGKSHVTVCYLLWRVGHDPTERGCVVSATEMQASKVLNLVRQYIDTNEELRMVFPLLRRGQREGDKWTDSAIVVDRPTGIKDPTLQAVGVETNIIQGSRISFVLADDVVIDENSATPEERLKVLTKLQSKFESRLDPRDPKSKFIIVNTPFHHEDAVEMTVRPSAADGGGGKGWAHLRMDAYGDITVVDDERVAKGFPGFEPWDSPHLRPTLPGTEDPRCRLTAHDPDPDNEKTLFPVKWPTAEHLDRMRHGKLPAVFNQTLRCIVRDDATAMCPAAYVQRCYAVARALGVRTFAVDLDKAAGGPFKYVFTGVDPAFTEHDKSDYSAVFTFGVRDDGVKVVLDLTYGKWSPPMFAQVVTAIVARFNSVVAIEDNSGGGVLISFMKANNMGYPIKPMRTGQEKWSPEHGVATFFTEMEDGSWAFPTGRPPAMVRLAEDCLNYVPTRHTPDLLMAGFVARKLAKKWGVLNGSGPLAQERVAKNAKRFAEQRKALELRQARGAMAAGRGAGGLRAGLMAR
jgi:hypothetical protein